MNRRLFGKALAEGVEAAYALSFAEARAQLEAFDLMSGDIDLDSPNSVHWVISPIQIFHDDREGASVEIKILATDGVSEDYLYVYIRERPLPASSGAPETNFSEPHQ